MVKMKEPGMAVKREEKRVSREACDYLQSFGLPARVYLVQTLRTRCLGQPNATYEEQTKHAHSDTKAAFPRTVSSTMRYSVVPQNQCPVSFPSLCLRVPPKVKIEKKNRSCGRGSLSQDLCAEGRLLVHTHNTVIKGVPDPLPERRLGEESVALT